MLRRLATFHSILSLSPRLPRAIHGSYVVTQCPPNLPNTVSHGAESYFVDGDETPPGNSVYKVDATSDAAQSAYDPPSGPWSQVGAGSTEYRTVSKDEPYQPPIVSDLRLEYGGKKNYAEDKETETSNHGEGPEGSERRGRKPEGRA